MLIATKRRTLTNVNERWGNFYKCKQQQHMKIDRFESSGKYVLSLDYSTTLLFVTFECILPRKPPAANARELWRQMFFTF